MPETPEKKNWVYYFGYQMAYGLWRVADFLDKHMPGFEDGSAAAYLASLERLDRE